MPAHRAARYAIALSLAGALALAGCSAPGTTSSGSPSSDVTLPQVSITETIASGLVSPWGLATLKDGTVLVSERDTGLILRIAPDGTKTQFTRIKEPGREGEGGLLGIAVDPAQEWVYAYVTTGTDNRVTRVKLSDPEQTRQDVLIGIPKSNIHNGGRLAFGPDGMLYVSTGDASQANLAQDLNYLGGKILRITPDGLNPPDNPFPGSPVWSLGHRNVQGIAFDSGGQLWATEFGANDVDELNLIKPGANYGWPLLEGASSESNPTGPDGEPLVNPQAQWSPTSIASPSGLAIVDDIAYVASLRGQRLWQVPLSGESAGEPVSLDLGNIGRLRTINALPDGTMLLLTSNTDGNGKLRDGDDHMLVLTVQP